MKSVAQDVGLRSFYRLCRLRVSKHSIDFDHTPAHLSSTVNWEVSSAARPTEPLGSQEAFLSYTIL